MLGRLKQIGRQGFPHLYHRSRDARHTATNLLFRRSVVQHDYGGVALRMHIRDPLARGWYDRDWPRPTELDLLARHGLCDGALVFDLGAHQNLVAMLLAHAVGPRGRVLAVEGSAHNARVGAANASLNGIGNLTTMHAVVGAGEARLGFAQTHNGQAASAADRNYLPEIRSVSIDGLAREFGTPGVVFIDIEGYEREALRGARQTLAGASTWLIELHGDATLGRYGSSNRDVVACFADGWRLHFRDQEDGPFRPGGAGDAVPDGRCWLLAAR